LIQHALLARTLYRAAFLILILWC